MAYSYAESTASGSTAIFTVPFEYISKAYVHVSVNGVLVDDALLTWNSSTEIVLPTTPAAGATVRRYRTTPKTPLVTFQSGDLSTADLNLFAKQCSHLVQEATDTGDSVEAALVAVSEAIQAAVVATTAAQTAVSAVEAALADLAEQDLSAYSTTVQIVEMLGNYTPVARTIAGGDGIKINGGASATLEGTVTIGLDPATGAETIAGLLANKPVTPAGLHTAFAALLGGVKNVRLITTSGNVTPSAGVTKWVAFVVNGGHGHPAIGAASNGTGTLLLRNGANGGAGGIHILSVNDTTAYPAVIGASDGATTITVGGVSRTASNGLISVPEAPGSASFATGTAYVGMSGHGGSGPFGLGSGGAGGVVTGGGGMGPGNPGVGYGSGAGGQATASGTSPAAPAVLGGPGCILLWEF